MLVDAINQSAVEIEQKCNFFRFVFAHCECLDSFLFALLCSICLRGKRKTLRDAKDDLAASVTALTDLLAVARLSQWENGFDDGS